MPYSSGLDVHEYFDKALSEIATDADFDMDSERQIFKQTFSMLNDALGVDAFKRWNGETFSGKFLMSVFEVLATGTSKNITTLSKLDPVARSEFLVERAKALWDNQVFQDNSGAGVRGTSRLANLLPIAEEYLRPQ